MLEGLADPKRAPRPDITIRIGVTTIRVEAKVLNKDRAFAKLYVVKGMLRFLDSRYGEGGAPGVMMGYLLSGEPPEIVEWVNAAVASDLGRGQEEFLVPGIGAANRVVIHESQHPPSLRLVHYLIDLR